MAETTTRKASAREGALRIQRQLIRGEINQAEAQQRALSAIMELVGEAVDLLAGLTLPKQGQAKTRKNRRSSGPYDAGADRRP